MRKPGFTLLEIVLAIGLSGAVLALLATAINLYLMRVDASRTAVESAQLARTLLSQIANDLQAARYYAPATSSDATSSESESVDPTLVQGVFGTATELRIDRAAVWNWESAAQQMELTEAEYTADPTPLEKHMPQTVRYVLGAGRELLAADLAEEGVQDQPQAPTYAGLYREQVSTVAYINEGSTQSFASAGNDVGGGRLIAPEVVDIVFAYFDGTQLLDAWDSSESESLPLGVEIRLTLLEEPFETAVKQTATARDELRRHRENLVEYRRFVRLPGISAATDAAFPQPASQQSSQQQQQSADSDDE